jgi:hypothetical protein
MWFSVNFTLKNDRRTTFKEPKPTHSYASVFFNVLYNTLPKILYHGVRDIYYIKILDNKLQYFGCLIFNFMAKKKKDEAPVHSLT